MQKIKASKSGSNDLGVVLWKLWENTKWFWEPNFFLITEISFNFKRSGNKTLILDFVEDFVKVYLTRPKREESLNHTTREKKERQNILYLQPVKKTRITHTYSPAR